ncbi:protein cornichon [Anaeramoeba flamelloides]|uniref:Protein cornichon n=1 Tax=Anaeramoeba flamelloides TaxID=1746091 RepID=A0AAV8A4C9_9EUKA|nr:protein cornichon [Anaeramoeba flamelloides]
MITCSNYILGYWILCSALCLILLLSGLHYLVTYLEFHAKIGQVSKLCTYLNKLIIPRMVVHFLLNLLLVRNINYFFTLSIISAYNVYLIYKKEHLLFVRSFFRTRRRNLIVAFVKQVIYIVMSFKLITHLRDCGIDFLK